MLRVFGVAIIALFSASALAGNVSNFKYKPANFAFQGQDLLNRVDVSSLSGKDVSSAFYCRADVSAAGQVFEADCHNPDSLDTIQSQVVDGLSSMAFSPALVGDKAVAVRISFRVVLNQKAGEASMTLIPNLGTMQQQLGINYVEPQERLDTVDWFDRYSKSVTKGKRFLGGEKLVRVAAKVDATGVTEEVGVVEVDRKSYEAAKKIGQSLKRSKFIPGFVEDKPVAMPYLAIVSYQ